MTVASVAESAGTSESVLIWTLIGGHIVTLATLAIKSLIDQANRVQDRLDSESKARIILAEGAKREERINAKIDDLTETVAKSVGDGLRDVHVTIDREK
jgi:transaldolase